MDIQVISSIIKFGVKIRIQCQTSTAVPHFVFMMGLHLIHASKKIPSEQYMGTFAHQ